MKIKLTHREIRPLLDRSTDALDRTTTDRLAAARQHALQHQRTANPAWLGRDSVLLGHFHLSRRALNWTGAAIVAAMMLVNLTHVYHVSNFDHSEIDVAILTDDMPIEMYVD